MPKLVYYQRRENEDVTGVGLLAAKLCVRFEGSGEEPILRDRPDELLRVGVSSMIDCAKRPTYPNACFGGLATRRKPSDKPIFDQEANLAVGVEADDFGIPIQQKVGDEIV